MRWVILYVPNIIHINIQESVKYFPSKMFRLQSKISFSLNPAARSCQQPGDLLFSEEILARLGWSGQNAYVTTFLFSQLQNLQKICNFCAFIKSICFFSQNVITISMPQLQKMKENLVQNKCCLSLYEIQESQKDVIFTLELFHKFRGAFSGTCNSVY